MARWDNIEILQAVDGHQERAGGCGCLVQGDAVVSILATPVATKALTVPSARQRHSHEHATWRELLSWPRSLAAHPHGGDHAGTSRTT
jgi:hypothetical protein